MQISSIEYVFEDDRWDFIPLISSVVNIPALAITAFMAIEKAYQFKFLSPLVKSNPVVRKLYKKKLSRKIWGAFFPIVGNMIIFYEVRQERLNKTASKVSTFNLTPRTSRALDTKFIASTITSFSSQLSNEEEKLIGAIDRARELLNTHADELIDAVKKHEACPLNEYLFEEQIEFTHMVNRKIRFLKKIQEEIGFSSSSLHGLESCYSRKPDLSGRAKNDY